MSAAAAGDTKMLAGVLRENSWSSVYFSAINEFKEQNKISLKTRKVLHAISAWKPAGDDSDLLSLVANLYATLSMGHETTWSITKDWDHPYEGSLLLIQEIDRLCGAFLRQSDQVLEETVMQAVLHSCRCRNFQLGTKLAKKYKHLLTKDYTFRELSKILIAKDPCDFGGIPSSLLVAEHPFPGFLTKVSDWLKPLEDELASKSLVLRVADIMADAANEINCLGDDEMDGGEGILGMVDRHSADKLKQGTANHADTVTRAGTFRNRRRRRLVRAPSPRDPGSSASDCLSSEGAKEHSAPKVRRISTPVKDSVRKKPRPSQVLSQTPSRTSPPPSSALDSSPPSSPAAGHHTSLPRDPHHASPRPPRSADRPNLSLSAASCRASHSPYASSDSTSPSPSAASNRTSHSQSAALNRTSPRKSAALNRTSPRKSAALNRTSPRQSAALNRTSARYSAASNRFKQSPSAASDRTSPFSTSSPGLNWQLSHSSKFPRTQRLISNDSGDESTTESVCSIQDNFDRWLSKNSGWVESRNEPGSPKLRRPWSKQESELLFFMVKIHGVGNWRKMVDCGRFHGRTNVQIKDRWRTMGKTGYIRQLEKKFGI